MQVRYGFIELLHYLTLNVLNFAPWKVISMHKYGDDFPDLKFLFLLTLTNKHENMLKDTLYRSYIHVNKPIMHKC